MCQHIIETFEELRQSCPTVSSNLSVDESIRKHFLVPNALAIRSAAVARYLNRYKGQSASWRLTLSVIAHGKNVSLIEATRQALHACAYDVRDLVFSTFLDLLEVGYSLYPSIDIIDIDAILLHEEFPLSSIPRKVSEPSTPEKDKAPSYVTVVFEVHDQDAFQPTIAEINKSFALSKEDAQAKGFNVTFMSVYNEMRRLQLAEEAAETGDLPLVQAVLNSPEINSITSLSDIT